MKNDNMCVSVTMRMRENTWHTLQNNHTGIVGGTEITFKLITMNIFLGVLFNL